MTKVRQISDVTVNTGQFRREASLTKEQLAIILGHSDKRGFNPTERPASRRDSLRQDEGRGETNHPYKAGLEEFC